MLLCSFLQVKPWLFFFFLGALFSSEYEVSNKEVWKCSQLVRYETKHDHAEPITAHVGYWRFQHVVWDMPSYYILLWDGDKRMCDEWLVTSMGNEHLSLCRCHLSQAIQRQTLIKTQSSQHKSALCWMCWAFCLLPDCAVHLIKVSLPNLYSEFSPSLFRSLSLSLALSLSSMDRNDRIFTSPLTPGWCFSAQAYAKVTFYCEQLLPSLCLD